MMALSTSNDNAWLRPHPKLEGISLIDHLYNRLNGMYPSKWAQNFKDIQAIDDWKTSWAEAFAEEGLRPDDIAEGIRNCRRMFDWPPSLTQFMNACRLNLVPETAFHEAVRGMIERNRGNRGEWSHPAIFWAAVRVTNYELMNSSYATLKGRWENALKNVLAVGRWDPIPDAMVALPAPDSSEADRAAARKTMAAIGASGVLDPSGRDHRRWIGKVLARAKTKNAPSAAVITMARRAAGEAV